MVRTAELITSVVTMGDRIGTEVELAMQLARVQVEDEVLESVRN